MNRRASQGFTIVEIIIAIIVVAILTTITIVSYSSIQQRSRDSERRNHVTQIRMALDKYYVENGEYPPACSANGTSCSATNLGTYLKPYLPDIPINPRGTQYQYVRGTTGGSSYAIRVFYEAEPVCKLGVRMTASWFSSAPTCR
jgi:prepilin-type N-terminal cleavage/methylation domain-containing protein